jgi:hypothetical protein
MRVDLATIDDLRELKDLIDRLTGGDDDLRQLLETIADRQEIPRCVVCFRHGSFVLPGMLNYEPTCDCGAELATWREWNAKSDAARTATQAERLGSTTQLLPELIQPIPRRPDAPEFRANPVERGEDG